MLFIGFLLGATFTLFFATINRRIVPPVHPKDLMLLVGFIAFALASLAFVVLAVGREDFAYVAIGMFLGNLSGTVLRNPVKLLLERLFRRRN